MPGKGRDFARRWYIIIDILCLIARDDRGFAETNFAIFRVSFDSSYFGNIDARLANSADVSHAHFPRLWTYMQMMCEVISLCAQQLKHGSCKHVRKELNILEFQVGFIQ